MANTQEYLELSEKRVLYLTKDPTKIERQLAGEDIGPVPNKELLDRVSTDTYPTRACFRFDNDFMASQALTGLRLGDDRWVNPNEIRDGKFGVLVAGNSFGCGSSREHFPMSLKASGIKLVVAKSIERICAQNCQNIGLSYLEKDKTALLKQALATGKVSYKDLTANLDPISAEIIRQGGLFPYFDYHKDPQDLPKPTTGYRQMTGPEKIIARHMGVSFVKPGDTGFVDADSRYSYEIFAPFSEEILKQNRPDAQITDPDSIILFYDHSVLDPSLDAAQLAVNMRKMARKNNFKLYDGNRLQGAEGICHTIMLDRHVKPGQIILGTDSHTCTLGAAGALPIGIGATEWAAAMVTNKVRISVPSSIRIELEGAMPEGVMSKDVMLQFLSQPFIREGAGIGKIFEWVGNGLDHMSFDEQVVFANMSVEGGAFTSFIKPNKNSIKFLQDRYDLSLHDINNILVISDKDAGYDNEYFIKLSRAEPYVALPGDPRNGIPISELESRRDIESRIQKAYIGSCTGSKYDDLYHAARVLEGRKVHPEVQLFVQASSREVYSRAIAEGLINIFIESGATILPPGCGACVNFGPGTVEKGETGISSTNRNFLGRTGLGDMFLGNPEVVAASAILGQIGTTRSLKN